MGRLKVLVCAYACEPNAGSEYGVGWNLPKKLCEKNDIYVLTRSRCRDKIEQELLIHPVPGINFIFYDLPKWLYYKKEIGSNWGEQYNYLLWQLFSIWFVTRLQKKYHFDLIHHLTFNQYRTPSPGFFVNIPFVMGPVGGAETIADCFTQDLENHTARKEAIRKKGIDLKLFGWWCNKRNRKHILCSSRENMERLKPYKGNSLISTLPAIAFDPNDFRDIELSLDISPTFEMIYAGKLYDWKGVLIFLKAVKKGLIESGHSNFIIRLVGLRFENEQQTVKQWIEELNLSEFVVIIPFMNRPDLLKMLTTCSLSVYPAFRDSGSMSVLEASVLGCPTICFDAGGQDAFPDEVLLKIPVAETYEETLKLFADKLLWAYLHPEITTEIGKKARVYVYENLTWEKKIERINGIYEELLK